MKNKKLSTKPVPVIDYLNSNYGIKLFGIPVEICKNSAEMFARYELYKKKFPLAYELKKLFMYDKSKDVNDIDIAMFKGL